MGEGRVSGFPILEFYFMRKLSVRMAFEYFIGNSLTYLMDLSAGSEITFRIRFEWSIEDTAPLEKMQIRNSERVCSEYISSQSINLCKQVEFRCRSSSDLSAGLERTNGNRSFFRLFFSNPIMMMIYVLFNYFQIYMNEGVFS